MAKEAAAASLSPLIMTALYRVQLGDLPNTAAVVRRSSAAAFLPGQTANALQFPEAAPGTVSNISSGFNLTT